MKEVNMTEQQIIEGNKSIAEFLETEIDYTKHGETAYFFRDNENRTSGYLPHELMFHKSWNWLMPVIEEIEEFPYIGVHIEGCYCAIKSDEKYPGEEDEIIVKNPINTFDKFSSVYQTVIQFIKWHNQNK